MEMLCLILVQVRIHVNWTGQAWEVDRSPVSTHYNGVELYLGSCFSPLASSRNRGTARGRNVCDPDELIRQVAILCPERALLLLRYARAAMLLCTAPS